MLSKKQVLTLAVILLIVAAGLYLGINLDWAAIGMVLQQDWQVIGGVITAGLQPLNALFNFWRNLAYYFLNANNDNNNTTAIPTVSTATGIPASGTNAVSSTDVNNGANPQENQANTNQLVAMTATTAMS